MKVIENEKINESLEQFYADREWDQFHSIKNLTMALSVEASELVEIFQWMKENDSNDVPNDPKLKQKVKEEVADIFIYLTRIAKKSDIDLQEAVFEKMKKNAEKYPVEKAKGNSLKYNEF